MRRSTSSALTVFASLLITIIFVVPFVFIVVTAVKSGEEALLLDFAWPTTWHIWENVAVVLETRNYMVVRAFLNSTILTVASVTLMVLVSALVGYVLQRRKSRWNPLINFLVLTGLMMPPAVVPTIFLLQQIGLFATLPGLIFIEVAYHMSFCILLYRAFIATIPRDMDEAAIVDGARPLDVFFRVILPLLWPVTVTIIVVQTVHVFNDFVNPLYYLPGNDNVTVQLTLYNFQSQFSTSYQYLFMNILIITVPPLIVFLLFNRQIVAGMTAGAVKG